MMYYLYFIIGMIVGLAFGYCVIPSVGTLRIDRTDEKKDLYMIEIDTDLESLSSKKVVKLKIKSQEKHSS